MTLTYKVRENKLNSRPHSNARQFSFFNIVLFTSQLTVLKLQACDLETRQKRVYTFLRLLINMQKNAKTGLLIHCGYNFHL